MADFYQVYEGNIFLKGLVVPDLQAPCGDYVIENGMLVPGYAGSAAHKRRIIPLHLHNAASGKLERVIEIPIKKQDIDEQLFDNADVWSGVVLSCSPDLDTALAYLPGVDAVFIADTGRPAVKMELRGRSGVVNLQNGRRFPPGHLSNAAYDLDEFTPFSRRDCHFGKERVILHALGGEVETPVDRRLGPDDWLCLYRFDKQTHRVRRGMLSLWEEYCGGGKIHLASTYGEGEQNLALAFHHYDAGMATPGLADLLGHGGTAFHQLMTIDLDTFKVKSRTTAEDLGLPQMRDMKTMVRDSGGNLHLLISHGIEQETLARYVIPCGKTSPEYVRTISIPHDVIDHAKTNRMHIPQHPHFTIRDGMLGGILYGDILLYKVIASGFGTDCGEQGILLLHDLQSGNTDFRKLPTKMTRHAVVPSTFADMPSGFSQLQSNQLLPMPNARLVS